MSDDRRTEQLTEANKLIRKVIAGKGKIQANFYFAGDTTGKQAGLIVSLAARDKGGKKVASQGKELRKSINSAKFALGIVLMDGNKLTFEQHGGSASPSIMKKAFKDALITPEAGGLSQLRYLAKARIRKAVEGEPAEVDEGEEISGVESALLTQDALSEDELRDLQREQGSLAALNKQLHESFLSAESIAAEIADATADSQENLNALEARIGQLTDDSDPSELKAAFEALYTERKNLAELEALGPDPFDGDTVDETFQRSLDATSDQSSLAIRAEIEKLGKQAQVLLQRAESGDFENWQSEIGDKLKSLQDALNKCLRQLDGVLVEFGVIPKSRSSKGPPTPPQEISDTLGMDGAALSTFTETVVGGFVDLAPIVSAPIVQETQKTSSSISKEEDTVRLATESGDQEQIKAAFDKLNQTRKKLALLASVGADPFDGDTVDETFQRSLEATSDQSSLAIRAEIEKLGKQAQVLLQRAESGDFENWQSEIGDKLKSLQDALNKCLRQLDGVLVEFGVIPKSRSSKGPPTPPQEISDTLGMDGAALSTFTETVVGGFVDLAPIVSAPIVQETQKTSSSISKEEDTVRLATESGDQEQIKAAFDKLNQTRKKLALLASVGADPFDGDTVDETFQRSLEATSDQSLVQMRSQLMDINRSYDDLIKEIASKAGEWTREDVEAALSQRRAAAMKQLQLMDSLRAELG